MSKVISPSSKWMMWPGAPAALYDKPCYITTPANTETQPRGKRSPSPLDNLEAYRLSLGETQTEFWSRFGVSQSGGSRYETGRPVPRPTAMLVQAFADGVVDDKALALLRKKTSDDSIKRGMI
jgi:hypothetical protein